MTTIDHGVGCCPLLGEVHDRVGLVALEDLRDKLPVEQVPELAPYGLPAHLSPGLDPVLEIRDGRQTRCRQLVVDGPPDAVVHDDDLMAHLGEVQGSRPTAVAVTT